MRYLIQTRSWSVGYSSGEFSKDASWITHLSLMLHLYENKNKTINKLQVQNKLHTLVVFLLHGKQSTRLLYSLLQIFSKMLSVVNGKKQIQFMWKGYQIDCFRTQWKPLVSIQFRWRIRDSYLSLSSPPS
jgi:two-component SAPR family response regulator